MTGKSTKTYRVLAYVARQPNGARYSEIHRFILKISGLDWKKKDANGKRRYRSWWANNLTNSCIYSRLGILNEFCLKGADGRWRINALVTGKLILSLRTQRVVFRTRKRS